MSNQAAWLDGKGEKFRVDQSDIPLPGPNDIVIHNHSIAINPADWKIQALGAVWFREWPVVLGEDVAGVVHAVGENVSRFEKGDRVVAHCVCLATNKPEDGGFQLFSRAPASLTAKVPDNLSLTQASVLPTALDTAGHGLYDSRDKGFLGLNYPTLSAAPPSDQIFLVWGASSSTGALAIQLATASGAQVIAVAGKHNLDFVRSLGATTALDYNTPSVVDDIVEAIRSTTGHFAGVFDAISTEASCKYVFPIAEKLGGCNVAMTLPPPTDVPSTVKVGNIIAVNFDVNGPLWEKFVTPALGQGRLKPLPEPLIVGSRLEDVQLACNTNKAGVSAKKVVIQLQ
ncbi:hypothetical protein M409DRAFT_62221 [Zasmidium cellare ATCC 36951]|uniref:Enoyl reductase (ER) domain-containing protein n=1 Tax=Zasmidium cellare ATCC 36951 TaxID=1080233 RepID=A0A6A6D3U9_ZASCE|nr:uncharacterized protein M409DRAFT_62221 [Zasmidium cellare ATCC 36951]KAF2174057.1 hypothetical protein M409DRAFT_62221 [Zasmidium cellare ATCC 36951]